MHFIIIFIAHQDFSSSSFVIVIAIEFGKLEHHILFYRLYNVE